VDDLACALIEVLSLGSIGETYNGRGHNEKADIKVVESIWVLHGEFVPSEPVGLAHYRELITLVKDRSRTRCPLFSRHRQNTGSAGQSGPRNLPNRSVQIGAMVSRQQALVGAGDVWPLPGRTGHRLGHL